MFKVNGRFFVFIDEAVAEYKVHPGCTFESFPYVIEVDCPSMPSGRTFLHYCHDYDEALRFRPDYEEMNPEIVFIG